LQIEGLKFVRLRDQRLFPSTDQCECYCFHIFSCFLIKFLSPDIIRRSVLIDNYCFLCPITKADVSLVVAIFGKQNELR
jgi:hypothetical protein